MYIAADQTHRRVGPHVEFSDSNEQTIDRKIAQALDHADVDALNPAARMKFPKRILMRVARLFLSRQAAYNFAVVDAVRELNHNIAILHAAIDQQRRADATYRAGVALQLDHLQMEDQTLSDRVVNMAGLITEGYEQNKELTEALTKELNERVKASSNELESIRLQTRETGNELNLISKAVDTLVADLRRTGAAPLQSTVESLPDLSSAHGEKLYEAFEDEFRGPKELITERLREYLGDVSDLRGTTSPIVDLGAGRGEFLRLLRDHEIPCFGIDINERFAKEASVDGLEIRVGDAIEGLAALEPRSVGAITSFQLVEHLKIEDVSRLIQTAFSALIPGGVLILETPNSSNLRVGASTFYRDPTHVRSIHPDLLSFLVRHHGYVGVETRFSSPSPEYQDLIFPDLNDSGDATFNFIQDLRWAIYGPQDYAVVGRKPVSATA